MSTCPLYRERVWMSEKSRGTDRQRRFQKDITPWCEHERSQHPNPDGGMRVEGKLSKLKCGGDLEKCPIKDLVE